MELKVPLYQHQLASIYQMEKREEKQSYKDENTVIDYNISVNADKTGYGKCNGRNTPIIMYDGNIKMVQDIKVGELLMGDDSTPRKVLSLARGKEPMYKIIQNVGNDYTVNESHILSLKHFKSVTKIDICLRDYLLLPKTVQKQLKGYKSFVDCWKDQLDKNDLDPYFIGLWLGNEYSNNPKIITTDVEIQQFLETKFPDYKSYNNIINVLRKYNILNHSHIPHKYKVNTRANRLKLLAGLIDSNGYYKKSVYKIIQKTNQLSDDIKFLCRSLGYICTHEKITKTGVLSISGSNIYEIPVLLQRKKAYKTIPTKNQLCTGISVQPLGIDDYYGFSIDNNRRYLLGDFTVTHNTLAMATLVYRDKMEWDISTSFEQSTTSTFAGGRIKKTTIKYYEKLDVTLVLASQSIINQWYEECQKTPLCVTMITTKKLIDTVLIENYDIVLVTPTMYNKLVRKYEGMAWKRFIFDEPGHMRVPTMYTIQAGYIWLVTATPNSIISMHRNCRNSFMFDIIKSAGYCAFSIYFDYMIVKNDDNFIQHSFSMPPTIHFYYKCYNPIFKALRGLVTDNITEMISAGNIQGAIKALGGGVTKNIVELVNQKKTDELKELESRLHVLLIRNKNTNQIEMLKIGIVRVKNQIKSLNIRFTEMLKSDCSICFSKISNPVMEPNCQNIFCGECLLKWLVNKENCPLCRGNIKSNELVYINIDGNEQKSNNKLEIKQLQTKNNTIIKLIKDNENGKFIIFSA